MHSFAFHKNRKNMFLESVLKLCLNKLHTYSKIYTKVVENYI